MRTLYGTTPASVNRRGIGLDRLAVLSLRRDGFGATPTTRTLWLGERTHYRASAWVLDAFDQGDGALDPDYRTWTAFVGLIVSGGAATPAALGGASTDRFNVCVSSSLPIDQWAEVTIVGLSSTVGGGLASVGVGLRMTATGAVGSAGSGYLCRAWSAGDGITHTSIARWALGAEVSVLFTEAHPWRAGDVFRATAEWNRLRIYQNGTCVADMTDGTPLITVGYPAIEAWRALSSDVAALDTFAAGPLRQEYIGAIADLGDVSTSLGLVEPTASPAAWDMTVVNVAPMGGASRFAALIRHGDNDGPNTYDLIRAPVTVAHAVTGGSVPLSIAEGRVHHAEAMTESVVRLVCAGRDAFLTPNVQASDVVYLPGPSPISTPAPLPTDPCGADAIPTIDAGPAPTEPPALSGDVGGPEQAPRGDTGTGIQEDGAQMLLGTYQVLLDYTFNPDRDPSPGYEGTTTVTQVGVNAADVAASVTRFDNFRLETRYSTGDTTSIEFPSLIRYRLMYRGPDVPGTDLHKDDTPWFHSVEPTRIVQSPAGGYQVDLILEGLATCSFASHRQLATVDYKMARYNASAIHSVADLQAIRPFNPDESDRALINLTRIETCFTIAITTDPNSSPAVGDWDTSEKPVVIPTNQFVGPQILALEVGDNWQDGSDDVAGSGASIRATLDTRLTWNATIGAGDPGPADPTSMGTGPGSRGIGWSTLA